MEKVDWIKEIHRFYLREEVVLSSYHSNAPHGRMQGQFGRQQSVKGYEHVFVYLQLSPNIDFAKVKYFIKFHLLEWVINNRDYKEVLDIFFFNNEKKELIHNKKSWTRFDAPNISLLDFIDNTIKQVNLNYIRTLQELYPQKGMYTQYNQGRHPNHNDLLIFITDRKGCDLADNLKELLKRRIRKIVWVKLEKEKDVIIEKRKIPILNDSLEKITNEMELEANINNISNHLSSKKYLDKSDFYLYYRTSDPWINQGMAKPIEISGNILTIADDLRISFLRNMGETYLIPVDRVIELKNKLLYLNIFQIEKDYPSISMDGTRWKLSVKFGGKSIRSKGHNNFPARWNQIVDAIEDCIKYKSSVNIQEGKIMSNNKMQKKYLPFDEGILIDHFAPVGKNVNVNENHLIYYKKSIVKYESYKKNKKSILGKPLCETSKPCQIQKDERFWTVNTLMSIYYSSNRVSELCILFEKAFGKKVPISIGANSWEKCLSSDNLELYFEVDLPSPISYKDYLCPLYEKGNIQKHQIIPFILASAHGKKKLEGSTQVDALIVNPDNGFNVLIEAKVLSDISISITYDVVRNQIARNIDVMLEKNGKLCDTLKKRDPNKSLFLLLTPKLFKDNPNSRLYGYKIREYQDKNKGKDALLKDLPHRKEEDLQDIPSRIGWLTWEDFKEVNKKCSPWSLDEKNYL